MADIKTTQRREPYTGTNILGAGIAGFRTPQGSGLTPEAEQMLRESYIRQLVGIAKLEQEMAIQSITSQANVISSAQNATSRALQAFTNLAATQGMENKRIQDGILAIESMGSSIIDSIKSQANADAAGVAIDAAGSLQNTLLANIPQFVDSARNRLDPRQAAEKISRDMALASQSTYSNAVAPEIAKLRRSGANVVVISDTRDFARAKQLEALDAAYDSYIQKLDPSNPWDKQVAAFLRSKGTKNGVIVGAMQNGIRDEDIELQNNATSIQEKEQAVKARAAGNARQKALRDTLLEMSIGIPREVGQQLLNLTTMSSELMEKGPEEFAKSLQEMPTPISVQLTKQKVESALKELDNPTDELSNAVARYAAAVPFFETYMAAMGFDDVYKAATYLKDRPDEMREYVNLVKGLVASGEYDQLKRPEAIQERLRVAGSSGKKSLIRTTNLTKPIERLFGIAVNRRPAFRYFEGTNSTEQLEKAIEALQNVGAREFEATLTQAERDEIDKLDGESLTTRERTPFDTFASSVPEQKRANVLSAAQKYLQRLNEDKSIRTVEGDEIYTLPGVVPPPNVTPMPEPEPEPVAQEKKREFPVFSGAGTGGMKERYEKNLEKAIEEQSSGAPSTGSTAAARFASQKQAGLLPPGSTSVPGVITPRIEQTLPGKNDPAGVYDSKGRRIKDLRDNAVAAGSDTGN